MRSTKIDLAYFQNKCKKVFGDAYNPDVFETNIIMGSTEMSANHIVFTNGGQDPW